MWLALFLQHGFKLRALGAKTLEEVCEIVDERINILSSGHPFLVVLVLNLLSKDLYKL